MTEIRLYKLNIKDISDEKIFAGLYDMVPKERQDKIDRIKFDEDKRRCLGAGVLLVSALDDYGIPNDERILEYGEHGKPYLKNYSEVKFNITHSGDYVVLAVNDGGIEIGCDVEFINEKRKIDNVARRILNEKESERLSMLKATDKVAWTNAFYDIWTAKESVVKAIGIGLGIDFANISIDEIADAGDKLFLASIMDTDEKLYVKRVDIDDNYSLSICSLTHTMAIIDCECKYI